MVTLIMALFLIGIMIYILTICNIPNIRTPNIQSVYSGPNGDITAIKDHGFGNSNPRAGSKCVITVP